MILHESTTTSHRSGRRAEQENFVRGCHYGAPRPLSLRLSTITYMKCIIGSAEGAFAAFAALQSTKSLPDMSTRSGNTECMDVSTTILVIQLDMMSLFNTRYPKEGSLSRSFEERKKWKRIWLKWKESYYRLEENCRGLSNAGQK